MSLVFVNYRGCGEAYAAALLDERLSRLFGPKAIFRASRSISAGTDYELAILEAIDDCRAMLVLIGPTWTEAFTDTPRASQGDWVRREIVEAYKRDVPVIPVLLAGARRLAEEDVPADLAQLSRSQYLRFDYRNLEQDSKRIAQELQRVAPEFSLRFGRRFIERCKSRLFHQP